MDPALLYTLNAFGYVLIVFAAVALAVKALRSLLNSSRENPHTVPTSASDCCQEAGTPGVDTAVLARADNVTH